MIQIHAGKRRIVRGALDSIRARTDLVNPTGTVNKSRLWHVYWSALVATTPLYEKNRVILGDSEVRSSLPSMQMVELEVICFCLMRTSTITLQNNDNCKIAIGVSQTENS